MTALGVFGELLGENTPRYIGSTLYPFGLDILVHQYFYKLHLTDYLRTFKPHFLIDVVLNHRFNVLKI